MHHSLTFLPSFPQHSGTYGCRVTSVHGSETKTVTVRILPDPATATSTAAATTTTAASVAATAAAITAAVAEAAAAAGAAGETPGSIFSRYLSEIKISAGLVAMLVVGIGGIWLMLIVTRRATLKRYSKWPWACVTAAIT
jgi:microcystin-dependent protein